MNVAQTVVSGNSDVTNKTSRQDRDSASKQGGSGFSDTLGSLDRGKSSSSNASSATVTSGSASSTPASASGTGTATTTSGGQSQTSAQTTATDGIVAPPTPALAVGAKGIVSNSMFLNAGTAQPAQTALNDATLTDGTDTATLTATATDNVALAFDAESEAAALPEMSDLAKLVTALSKSVTPPASSDADAVADDGEQAGDADTAPAAGESIDLLSLLAATAMPVTQSTPAVAQGADTALKGVAIAGPGAEAVAEGTAATSTVVRLQKQDAPAIDFHIETQEDGSAKLDVSKATGDVADVVQVVESRRFVGMAAASNATAISSAMAADPDWATTMAGQTSNSPMISSTGQVVHVLKIQMTPVELGHVTAAMKLVGDELSVQLTAHTLKGYSELQKDGSDILEALKSQGFNVDKVTVTLASSADRQDSSTSNRQPTDAGQQGAQQGQRGSDDRSQEQFYRQPARSAREETTSYETISQPETPSSTTSARPDHVYL